MNRFYNLKTAQKLALGFGLCLTLSMVIGGVAVSRMAHMNKNTKDLLGDTVVGEEGLLSFQRAARVFRTDEYQYALSSTPAEMGVVEVDMAQREADAQKALKTYDGGIFSPEDRRNFDALQDAWQQYDAMKAQFLPLSHANNAKACNRFLNGPMKSQFDKVAAGLDTMIQWNHANGQGYADQAQAAYKSAFAIVVTLLVVSVTLGSLTAWFITRYMTGTLAQVSDRLQTLQAVCMTNLGAAVQAMEHGDLTAGIVTSTTPLRIDTKDEFGVMASTFNAMLERVQSTISSFRKSQSSLAGIVRDLQGSAAQVASASGTLSATSQQVSAAAVETAATMQEIASASDQSARGASEIAQGGTTQAAALAQGSALVKQLGASVHGVARDSQAATEAAADATAVALEGAQTVSQSVASMQNIHRTVSESAQVVQTLGEASRQIGGIVQTIDEIAGQTNLLALNAAIEAARAGDAGRGFAVVADEVRKLAERSAAATREISSLIDDVQSRTERAVSSMRAGTEEVQNGRDLAQQAGEALGRIQSVVRTVTERIGGIQTATSDMTDAADEVARAITEVAAVVEESSAAAEEMSASAEQVAASVQTVAGTIAQQSSAVDELGASATALSEIARTLEAVTAQFRVSDSEAAAPASRPALALLRAA